jgi:hypothetical protein
MMERIRDEAHIGGRGHPAAPSEKATSAVERGDTGFDDPQDR